MRSSLRIAALVALAAAHTSDARAHGLVPAPQSIIASDAKGVRAVRLTEGLALRAGDGFRYVCPAAWGGTYALVLAAAMPDGTVAVATGSGIEVLADDGTFAPHADPLASGQVIAFAATSTTLYALIRHGDATELIAFGAGKPRRRYADSVAWNDVAASEDQLLLLRYDGVDIQQLLLSADDELGGDSAPAPDGTAAVFARLAGSTAYVVATVRGGLELDLGRIERGAFQLLQTASANLAGPIETADGHRFVAIEGVLSRFDDERVGEIETDAGVTCLGRDGTRSYACTRSQIRALDADGLRATLFDITQLQDPDLSVVPEPLRTECSTQWDHFRFDLVASGVMLASDRDGGASDAGARDAGAAMRRDAGKRDHRAAPRDSGGCTAASGPHPSSSAGTRCALLLLLALRRPLAAQSSGRRSRKR